MIKLFIVLLFTLSNISCDSKITLPLLNDDAVILAFGDSLTRGTGSSRENAYPAVLENILEKSIEPNPSHIKVINAGIPGEISQKGLIRLPALIKKHQPDLIILCHGANDILRKLNLSNTQNNIQQMIDLARQQNISVVLIGVPEFSLLLNTSPIYQKLADDNMLVFEKDILGDILSNASLKSDHVHPNSKGYQLLAETIAALLVQTGAITPP